MLERVVSIVISFGFYLVDECLNRLASWFQRRRTTRLVVLTYHAIKTTERSAFEKQMHMLVRLGLPSLVEMETPGQTQNLRIAVTFDDGYQSVVENALPVMRSLNIPATILITTGSMGKRPQWVEDSHAYSDEIVLGMEQLRSLSKSPAVIGSHSVTHPRLAEIDITRIRHELADSKRTLEKILGKQVGILSLPYGSYNRGVAQECADSGYTKILLNMPMMRFPKPGDVMIGRINMTLRESPIECRLKMTGAFRWAGLAARLKRAVGHLLAKGTRHSMTIRS